MRNLFMKAAVAALALALGAVPSARAAEKKVNLGVSIPAATHGFTGGIVYWANQAKKDLEKKHKDLKITVRTANGPPEQANQLQDLVTVTKIDNAARLPLRVGLAHQAGGQREGEGRLRDGGGPRRHRQERPGRLHRSATTPCSAGWPASTWRRA